MKEHSRIYLVTCNIVYEWLFTYVFLNNCIKSVKDYLTHFFPIFQFLKCNAINGNSLLYTLNDFVKIQLNIKKLVNYDTLKMCQYFFCYLIIPFNICTDVLLEYWSEGDKLEIPFYG